MNSQTLWRLRREQEVSSGWVRVFGASCQQLGTPLDRSSNTLGVVFRTPRASSRELGGRERGPAVPHARFWLVRSGHEVWKACEERAQERVCTRAKYSQNQRKPLNPHILDISEKFQVFGGQVNQPWRRRPIEPWTKLLFCRHAFPTRDTLRLDAILERRR